jgi:hypothetical protein
MQTLIRMSLFSALLGASAAIGFAAEDEVGFVSLFNGKDLSGWKVPAGDNGHWKVVDGVIDYDARSESKGTDRCLWSDKSFKDFVLKLDWRLKPGPGFHWKVPELLPSGEPKKDANGKAVQVEIEDMDSGVYVRGNANSQINIWMWPIGSGEVWGYRTDPSMPASVRAGVTPKRRADKPRGEWNSFEITMKGDRLTVKLNSEEVISNAELPGVPAEGPIALQHHGDIDARTGKWRAPPSLVQFKNIWIKELK